MSAEPTSRLSKRESTTTLRRDTLATSARKRAGSNASTTSKASLFTSPAKGFGLTRKASTAALSVAPVSVSGGLDHSINSTPKKATLDARKGKSTDKVRPVRQATRAEESLRGVQSRAPASVAEPELAPLSESPKNIPAPLPNDSAPVPISASPASSTKIPRSKSRTSMIPVFVGSPERTKTTSSNLSTSASAKPAPSSPRSASPRQVSRNMTTTPTKAPPSRTQPPSASPRQTTSKFRAPTMTPGHGLTRKASTSSIRSATNGFKPTLSSPLAAGSKPAPPAPPKLDTGSVSAMLGTTDPSQPSPSSASWLASIPGIRTKSSAPQPTPQIVSSPVETSSSPIDNKVSSSEATPIAPIPKPEGQSPVSSTDTDHDALVLVTAPTSPIVESNSNTYRINSLAAQHASSWANTPASWLAWIASTPGLSTGPELPSSGLQGTEVMNIDSDEEALTEDNGRTPAVTPGVYDGQRMWGWGGRVRMSEESRMSAETERQVVSADKGKRPAAPDHSPSVDSVVPALPSADENGTDSGTEALTIKPVTQNPLGLNSAALRYALQLPLLGRPKQNPIDHQSRVNQHENSSHVSQPPYQPLQSRGESSTHSSKPGVIVTRYSDDHDFVIIEVEVDGWILIDTEGTSPITPYPMPVQSTAARLGAAGSSLWNYYTGRGAEDPSAPDRVETTGPAAEMSDELSSLPPATEAARDTDSINSSLLPNVLRPFGRGKDSGIDRPASAPGHESVSEGKRRPKTQAELIKEEALARQSPSVVPALPSPVLNTATKSSWVSYFSSAASRSAPTMSDGRAVSQRGENTGEMEVMNIDENELTEPVEIEGSTPSSRSPATRAHKTAASKPASPLTDSPSIKHKASVISQDKKSSASSTRSAKETFPNLLLPTYGDTFYTVPRCVPPRTSAPSSGTTASASSGSWGLKRKVKNISTMLFNTNASDKVAGPNMVNAEMEEYQRRALERYKLTNRANFAVVEPAVARARNPRPGSTRSLSGFGSLPIDDFGNELPRVFSLLGQSNALGDIAAPIRAAVIGVHGWFPGPLVRSVFGEPTGTSVKFATMGVDALRQFAEKHDLELESVTPMPLEGEGTIERRVTKLYDDLLKHPQWLADLHRADVVLVATHSQGSIVSTHLIARLISDGHIRTKFNRDAVDHATEQTGVIPPIAPHRICCLAMCGIHMGPLYSLNSSSFAQPYLQWFESQAARELFEFQNTESEVSRNYVAALSTALDHGTKFVYIASLNDQVVPIYSGAFVAASHPLILRGLFLDGDAYSSSDFLSNLLVLLLRVKNAGLDEHGLVVHLSEATAGSLSGIGHSTAYEDLGPYTLAVRYMFETSDLAPDNNSKLSVDTFQAHASRNDYEIPWLLHTVLSDVRISRIFSSEIAELRESFAEWKPTTAVLRDIQRKLAPIRMSPLRHSIVSAANASQEPANSKL